MPDMCAASNADLVGNCANLPDRMRKKVEASTDRDELRSQALGIGAQRIDIDRVAHGIDRRRMRDDAVEARGPGAVVRDVAADRRRRRDDDVAGLRRHHEDVEIGERAGPDADLCIARAEDFRRQLGRQHLDLLDALQPHLVFVAGIAERGARADAGRKQRLGLRVHDVGGGIEVDAVALMDRAVLRHIGEQVALDLVGAAGRDALGQRLHITFGRLGNPGTGLQHGHLTLSVGMEQTLGHSSDQVYLIKVAYYIRESA